jgi:phage terminase small subunit
MTEKQKIFADEYLIDLNATRAYKVAYPRVKNDKVAAAAAARLLRNVNVKKYISEQLEKIHNEKTADAQEVMEYLTAVLRGKSTAHEIVVEGIGDGMSKAKVMEKNPSEKERLKAAELLGRRYSLFADKLEVSGLESEQTKLDDLIQQMRGGG